MPRKVFFRWQNLSGFDAGPSTYGVNSYVKVLEPADNDGWEGYWWGYLAEDVYEDDGGRLKFVVRSTDDICLIPKHVVKDARNGEIISEIYVPGVFGVFEPSALHSYATMQAGAASEEDLSGSYVGVYLGDWLEEYQVFSGHVFSPIKLLKIYPAAEFFRKFGDCSLSCFRESDDGECFDYDDGRVMTTCGLGKLLKAYAKYI